jgi:hypothetical protein
MDLAMPERTVGEALQRRRRQEAGLTKRAKGDVGKVKLADRLRTETVMTVKWFAERLQMGTAGYVNNRMYRWRNDTMP